MTWPQTWGEPPSAVSMSIGETRWGDNLSANPHVFWPQTLASWRYRNTEIWRLLHAIDSTERKPIHPPTSEASQTPLLCLALQASLWEDIFRHPESLLTREVH